MAKKQDEGVLILSALEEDIATTLGGRSLYGKELLDLMNAARQKVGMRSLGVGSLYPTLKRMEEANLIAGDWGEPVAEATRRRYYRLTAEGVQALSRSRAYRNLLAQQSQPNSPEGQPVFNSVQRWIHPRAWNWQGGM